MKAKLRVIKEDVQHTKLMEEENSLIEKCKLDAHDFKILYERYFKRIFLFVLHRVGDKAISADITSQVFLKALINLKKYSFRGLPFSAWLFRIALNECNDFFRSNTRHRIVSLQEETLDHLFEEMTAENKIEDFKDKLPAILQRLSVPELHIIELRFFEQRPFKEVGDILGITETYAKVKVYRVLDKMKKLFLTPHEAKN